MGRAQACILYHHCHELVNPAGRETWQEGRNFLFPPGNVRGGRKNGARRLSPKRRKHRAFAVLPALRRERGEVSIYIKGTEPCLSEIYVNRFGKTGNSGVYVNRLGKRGAFYCKDGGRAGDGSCSEDHCRFQQSPHQGSLRSLTAFFLDRFAMGDVRAAIRETE